VKPKYLYLNYVLVSAILFILAVIFEYSGLDLWLEGHFYDTHNGWIFREHWLTDTVLHRGARTGVVIVGVVLLISYISSFFKENLRPYRASLLAAIVGGFGGVLIVAILKNITHIYSPWDLRQFGGTQPYLRLFDHAVLGSRVGHAFPAGHASGGFALLFVYFWAQRYWKNIAGIVGLLTLAIGLVFGLAQQMRGAHFMSHDMVALAICWTSLCVSFAWLNPEPDAQQEEIPSPALKKL
jgi:membrane-associated PAP2 superfamily phosphatase